MDIGTGTGIIGILLCKKSKLNKIFGIEIQEEVAEMADRSVKMNNLSDKMEIVNTDINNIFDKFKPNSIDAIVTNPPYMKMHTGVVNIDERKLISRHEIKCNLEDIISKSYKLLKDQGEFYMIHRSERIIDVAFMLRKYKIEPKEIRFIHSKQNDAPKLVLVKAIKNAGEYLKILEPLIIYNDDGSYTNEILKIYGKEI